MKNSESFPWQPKHQILLSEKLRRIRIFIREAESAIEFEMAMREMDRIIQDQERLEDQSGA